MKRSIWLVIIAIPLSSVLMGGVMLYFATAYDDSLPVDGAAPLSKTSWQAEQ